MAKYTETAAAKINLFLHVTGKRPDGYHILSSQVSFAKDIADRLSFTPGGDNFTLIITGAFKKDIPAGHDNLVYKAVTAFEKKYGLCVKGCLALQKNLPAGAGIGGGSADAAATLRLLARAYNIRDPKGLEKIARPLGADVLMCLGQMPCMTEGIGDKIFPLLHLPAGHIVLVNAGTPLLTKDVFQKLRNFNDAAKPAPMPPLPDCKAYFNWLAKQRNDLSKPAEELCRDIQRVKAALAGQKNTELIGMSGSGATCFALFSDRASAEAARRNIAKRHPHWWVRRGMINHK